jgi:hypothetical protein
MVLVTGGFEIGAVGEIVRRELGFADNICQFDDNRLLVIEYQRVIILRVVPLRH